ncbi:MAG: NUDIX hydrolase [Bacteroidales bacterium]|nr:NUDIX hydrolase [Bacteroidales bacterium]MBR6991073.1 NUDIX hydrolase [Bacteroidales bacterium]
MYSYKYPRPAVTADCVVIGSAADSSRYVLLIQRGNEPYKGCWALPGGFMDMDETLEQCALRELKEETGLTPSGDITELKSFSTVDRDPRGRTITVAFLIEMPLTEAKGGDDAADARWFPLNELPPLAFDHDEIIKEALARIQ